LHQLERALGLTRIAIGEADIGIDHTDECHQRKIMSLGDELCANDNIASAIGDRIKFRAHTLRAAGKIGRQRQDARLGEKFFCLFRETLHTRPASGERINAFAFRAGIGAAFNMSAMVAHKRFAKAMFDKPGRAIGTLKAMSAITAESEGRIAAPIEEKQEEAGITDTMIRSRVNGRMKCVCSVESLGLTIGIDSFGASAPAPVLFDHFGLTVAKIVPQVLARLG
jgi:hypothetical protein